MREIVHGTGTRADEMLGRPVSQYAALCPSVAKGYEAYSERDKNFRFQWTPRDTVLQRHPVQKLHGNERLSVLFVDFIASADVGMVQSRGGFGFALKAAQGVRVLGNFIGQNLRATKRFSRVSSVLYTTPMPPPPNFSMMR